jgi:hypothetical protein
MGVKLVKHIGMAVDALNFERGSQTPEVPNPNQLVKPSETAERQWTH